MSQPTKSIRFILALQRPCPAPQALLPFTTHMLFPGALLHLPTPRALLTHQTSVPSLEAGPSLSGSTEPGFFLLSLS